ncbi:uncharacterized protein IUM83_15682 [Phytophthora cinnamomi]|uniref:uncharacterized protein n=1 Tax=Phytophthora cinnamomi TaxID=4785 RepID=UPI00355A2CBC|nr:hypothetical protein IUM83_15682 [Phytophthora cinnamomi]
MAQFADAANAVDAGVAMPVAVAAARRARRTRSWGRHGGVPGHEGRRALGRVLLAPNSVVQFGQLCGMFAYIENDAFVRAAADAAGLGDGTTLAKVFCITKGSAAARPWMIRARTRAAACSPEPARDRG